MELHKIEESRPCMILHETGRDMPSRARTSSFSSLTGWWCWLSLARRKCIFVYHYFDDPVFGFGHIRIQSWLPFNISICLNGRHWLEKQLQKEGIGYIKDGNCFPWIEDIDTAQNLLNEQFETNWSQTLMKLALKSCPALSRK